MENEKITQEDINETKKGIQETLTFFCDSIGRTIVGLRIDAESTDSILALKDPAIVNFDNEPAENGTQKLSVQIIPVFFYGFMSTRKTPHITIKYQKANISMVDFGDAPLDFKIYEHYFQMFYGRFIDPNSITQKEPPLKLFDN